MHAMVSFSKPGTLPLIIDDLVPRAEVSRQLDVTEQTLRLWELAGEGPPPIRIGRRVFYRVDVLRRWLLDQERRSSTA